jgi:hypothetical protein
MTTIARIARGVSLAALTAISPLALAQTMYRVVELPIVAKSPIAIKSNGKLLVEGINQSYYICSKTRCNGLPDIRDFNTHWTAINDRGMLTGDATRPTGGIWAVRKDPEQGGGAHYLTPGRGAAIAPDGAIVGKTDDFKAFLFTDHRIELNGLTERFTDPHAINSHHVIVGSSYAADGRDHATLWVEGGPPQDLGLYPGHYESVALAINDAGVAVGVSRTVYPHYLPARFADGEVQVFLLPHNDDDGAARAINSAGTIVGYINTRRRGLQAGIVEGDRMVNLNTRLRPQDAHRYNLWTADAINDAGQIAALHVDELSPQGKAVRLEPVVER